MLCTSRCDCTLVCEKFFLFCVFFLFSIGSCISLWYFARCTRSDKTDDKRFETISSAKVILFLFLFLLLSPSSVIWNDKKKTAAAAAASIDLPFTKSFHSCRGREKKYHTHSKVLENTNICHFTSHRLSDVLEIGQVSNCVCVLASMCFVCVCVWKSTHNLYANEKVCVMKFSTMFSIASSVYLHQSTLSFFLGS